MASSHRAADIAVWRRRRPTLVRQSGTQRHLPFAYIKFHACKQACSHQAGRNRRATAIKSLFGMGLNT